MPAQAGIQFLFPSPSRWSDSLTRPPHDPVYSKPRPHNPRRRRRPGRDALPRIHACTQPPRRSGSPQTRVSTKFLYTGDHGSPMAPCPPVDAQKRVPPAPFQRATQQSSAKSLQRIQWQVRRQADRPTNSREQRASARPACAPRSKSWHPPGPNVAAQPTTTTQGTVPGGLARKMARQPSERTGSSANRAYFAISIRSRSFPSRSYATYVSRSGFVSISMI